MLRASQLNVSEWMIGVGYCRDSFVDRLTDLAAHAVGRRVGAAHLQLQGTTAETTTLPLSSCLFGMVFVIVVHVQDWQIVTVVVHRQEDAVATMGLVVALVVVGRMEAVMVMVLHDVRKALQGCEGCRRTRHTSKSGHTFQGSLLFAGRQTELGCVAFHVGKDGRRKLGIAACQQIRPGCCADATLHGWLLDSFSHRRLRRGGDVGMIFFPESQIAGRSGASALVGRP